MGSDAPKGIQEKQFVSARVKLTEEQSLALRNIASQEHVSVEDIIRWAVDYWLQTHGAISVEERRRRALSVVGKFHSGKSDVSERHDKYLADLYGG